MSLERYWQAFSSIQGEVLGAIVLENRHLPILEVNAGYPSATGQIFEIKRFYAARGRPACLILPEGSSLELEANNAQFVAHIGFVVLEWESKRVPDWALMPTVEQVGWGAARSLAQTWCDQVGTRGWEVGVSNEIARVMPSNPNVSAYTAFEAERVVGMGFALNGRLHWLAGSAKTRIAIVKRAAFDSGISIQFSVNLEQISQFPLMRELGRYVVWTEVNPR